jgi:hypothetical protein
VTSTLLAVDVEFSDLGLALTFGAVELLSRAVNRRVLSEKVDSQLFIGLSFLRHELLESLQLDKGSRALPKALVEVRRQSNQLVHFLSRQLLLVLNEPHSCSHSPVVVFLVELPLAEEVEMDGFGALPGVGQGFVGRGGDVAGDQGVHRLGGYVGGCALGDVGHLVLEDSLFVGIHLKCSQNIDFLDQKRGSPLISEFFRNFTQ